MHSSRIVRGSPRPSKHLAVPFHHHPLLEVRVQGPNGLTQLLVLARVHRAADFVAPVLPSKPVQLLGRRRHRVGKPAPRGHAVQGCRESEKEVGLEEHLLYLAAVGHPTSPFEGGPQGCLASGSEGRANADQGPLTIRHPCRSSSNSGRMSPTSTPRLLIVDGARKRSSSSLSIPSSTPSFLRM